jgi:hypothetical protein
VWINSFVAGGTYTGEFIAGTFEMNAVGGQDYQLTWDDRDDRYVLIDDSGNRTIALEHKASPSAAE